MTKSLDAFLERANAAAEELVAGSKVILHEHSPRSGEDFSLSSLRTAFLTEFGIEANLRREDRRPRFPAPLAASVTHKESHWLAWIAPELPRKTRALGIDLEREFTAETLAKFQKAAQRTARAETLQAAFDRLPSLSENLRWSVLFAAFETGVKCLGNADIDLPKVPGTFAILNFQNEGPSEFDFHLGTSAGTIQGKVITENGWILSLGALSA